METKVAKENKEQVTFKSKELWAELQKLAAEEGSSVGRMAKELVTDAIRNRSASKPEKENLADEKKTSNVLSGDSEKLDVVAQLLAKILSSKEEENNETISMLVDEAVNEYKDDVLSRCLVLELTEPQKDLFLKLFKYRVDNNQKYCEKIEGLFFCMFLTYVENHWFNAMPTGFKKEFNQVFSDYLNPVKPKTEVEN